MIMWLCIAFGLMAAAGACCCYSCSCTGSLARECFSESHGMVDWTIISGTFTITDDYIRTASANAVAILNDSYVTGKGGINCAYDSTDMQVLNARIYFAYIDSSNYSYFESRYHVGGGVTTQKYRIAFVTSGVETEAEFPVFGGIPTNDYGSNLRLILCYDDNEIVARVTYNSNGMSCRNLRTATGSVGIGTGPLLSSLGSNYVQFKGIGGTGALAVFEAAEADSPYNSCQPCCPVCEMECGGELPANVEVYIPSTIWHGYTAGSAGLWSVGGSDSSSCNSCTSLAGTFILSRLAKGVYPNKIATHCHPTGKLPCLYHYDIGEISCSGFDVEVGFPFGPWRRYIPPFTLKAAITARITSGYPVDPGSTWANLSPSSDQACDPSRIGVEGYYRYIEVVLWLRSLECQECDYESMYGVFNSFHRMNYAWMKHLPIGPECSGTHTLDFNGIVDFGSGNISLNTGCLAGEISACSTNIFNPCKIVSPATSTNRQITLTF